MDLTLGTPTSFTSIIQNRNEMRWSQLSNIRIEDAVSAWLETVDNIHTRTAYANHIRQLEKAGILSGQDTLNTLVTDMLESTVDAIKRMSDVSEATRQARAAAYISLTRFLSRETGGMIRKAMPCKDGHAQTFFAVRDRVATEGMTQEEWRQFIVCLDALDPVHGLIARVQFQGGKRIGEVLQLTVHDVDFVSCRIHFQLSKSATARQTIITYPRHVIDALRELAENAGENGLLFLDHAEDANRMRTRLNRSYARAAQDAGIEAHISTHSLRVSAVTILKEAGLDDLDIMRVTGHRSVGMLARYDKRDLADNASAKINLLG